MQEPSIDRRIELAQQYHGADELERDLKQATEYFGSKSPEQIMDALINEFDMSRDYTTIAKLRLASKLGRISPNAPIPSTPKAFKNMYGKESDGLAYKLATDQAKNFNPM